MPLGIRLCTEIFDGASSTQMLISDCDIATAFVRPRFSKTLSSFLSVTPQSQCEEIRPSSGRHKSSLYDLTLPRRATSFTKSQKAKAPDEKEVEPEIIPPPEALGVKCDFSDMRKCKMKGTGLKIDCPTLPKDYAEKGKSIWDFYGERGIDVDWARHWWPGKAGKGECNNLRDRERGCWYPMRLGDNNSELGRQYCPRNEKGQVRDERCMFVLPADNEPSYRWTCPSWLRNKDGEKCETPENYQDCPQRFVLRRPDHHRSEEEQARNPDLTRQFYNSIFYPCHYKNPGEQDDHCAGFFDPDTEKGKEELSHTGMYFDILANKWYKCTPWFKCAEYPVNRIYDPQLTMGKCGSKQCKDGEDCFYHKDFGTKKEEYSCVPDHRTFVVVPM